MSKSISWWFSFAFPWLTVTLSSFSQAYCPCIFLSDFPVCDHFSIGVFIFLLIDYKMKEINRCLSDVLFPNLSFVFQSCLWHFWLYRNFSCLCSQICQSSLYGLCISYRAWKGPCYPEIIKTFTHISFYWFYCLIFSHFYCYNKNVYTIRSEALIWINLFSKQLPVVSGVLIEQSIAMTLL